MATLDTSRWTALGEPRFRPFDGSAEQYSAFNGSFGVRTYSKGSYKSTWTLKDDLKIVGLFSFRSELASFLSSLRVVA